MQASSPAIEIRLNAPQYRTLTSPKKIRVMVAGIGTGKSLAGGFFAMQQSQAARGARGLVLASTYDQLRDAVLPRMQEAWAMMGFFEEVHYVIGKRPPDSWGIDPYSSLNNSNVVTFCWGSYIKLGSAEKYNAHRGPAYDWIWGDEGRDWRDFAAAFRVLVGRLRGIAFMAAGLVSPFLLTTSPFDDPEELAEFVSGEDVEVVRGSTYDNAKHLPRDYIDIQRSTLDSLTFEREVMGKDVHMGGLLVCWAFSAERYPAGNVIAAEFDPTADLYLNFDFNSSATRPMSTVGYQPRMIDRVLRDVIVLEYINLRTQTATQVDIVYDDLIARGFRGRLFIRGDKTGEHIARGSAATQSDYMWIEKRFKVAPGSEGKWTYMGKETRTTLRKRNRWQALNSRWRDDFGVMKMLIADHCKKTMTACTRLRLAENGNDAEETIHNDPVTALSYGPYTDYPVHFEPSQTHSRG